MRTKNAISQSHLVSPSPASQAATASTRKESAKQKHPIAILAMFGGSELCWLPLIAFSCYFRRLKHCVARMPIENESIRKVCPECSAEIAVYEGLRTWCEQCNWNVAGESQRVDEGFLARRYVRIGERYGKAVLETLKLTPVHELRPGWLVRKIVAFLLAGSVHFLSAALLVVGILLIALGFPEVSLIVLGLSSCAFAWLMRLQPGKMPAKDIASRADFPALYGLVNAVG